MMRAKRAVLLRAAFVLFVLSVVFGSTSRALIAQTESPDPLRGGPPPAPAPLEPPKQPGPGAGPGSKTPGADIRISILTFGPGTHPFYKFGHNAIRVTDPAKRPGKNDVVYNWGMFHFGDPALLPKFAMGRFMYWMEPQGYRGTEFGYKREGRSIDEQVLDLSPEMKLEMVRLLEENALEENKYYKYDYYRDNCSTRVRDMVDKVTGGRVKLVTTGPARLDYRQQTSRLTADLLSEYVLLNLVMGDLIDKPRNKWEEAFIPMEFQKVLRDVTIVGEDGVERPIILQERRIIEPKLTPPVEDPPRNWPWSLAFGLAFGAVLAGFGRISKSLGGRIAVGVFTSLIGLVAGFFGIFFIVAWAVTDHEVGYRNENLMLCVPWALVLVGTGIRIAAGRAKSALFGTKLVRAALISSAIALVVKVLPWFDQDNWLFLVFFIPLWGGLFYALREVSKHLVARQLAPAGAVPASARTTLPSEAKKAAAAKAAKEKAASEKAAKGETDEAAKAERKDDLPED